MHSVYSLLKRTFIIALFFVLVIKSYGQHEPITIKRALQGSKHQVQVDSSIMVSNYYYYDTTYANHIDLPYTVRNIVTLKIDEASNIFLGSTFTATVSLRIFYPTDPEHPEDTTSTDKEFVINYNSSDKYTAKKSLVFYGAQKVTVTILSVNITDAVDNNEDSIPTALMVENQMDVEPNFQFSCSSSVISTVSSSDSSRTDPDELYVSWPNIMGADEYDLEWAYIDSSALSRYSSTNSKFDNNATRVTTKNLSYAIPLIYDNGGRLYFRVRAVQFKNNLRVEANWSSSNTGGLGQYGFRGHQRKLNWQSSITFAEDGKRKVVVQYFDGSLRSRQTVTKDNSSNTTVVAETFYDFQGRPVIQVLPAPTLNNLIKYAAAFNVDADSAEYKKTRYDTLTSSSAYCGIGADPMGTASGASQYYSSNNPNKNTGIDRFIPDAGGYPFVETVYTQDNTGRISKQSGVGTTFRNGSNHETQYIYSTPDQKELDALFGTEVGNASHYFKTMVRDGNGQYSISYTDMHGRTIATALAGTPPDSSRLDLLDSHSIDSLTEMLSDPSAVIIKDLMMEHKKSLAVEKAGNHLFEYSLSPETLRKKSCSTDTVCYDCLYDLRITITDDCNNQKLPSGKRFDTTIRNFSLVSKLDTLCNHDSSFHVSFTINLPEGNYEITKQLSVSRYAMEYYRDSLFMRKNTCKTLQQFIQEQKEAFLNSIQCVPNCQACKDSVGTWDTFRPRYMTVAGISISDSAANRGQAWASYLSALNECKNLCDSLDEEDDLRRAMLLDVTAPSGQYARPDSVDVYSIFYTSDELVTLPPYKRDTTRYTNEAGGTDYVFDNRTGQMVKPNYLDTAQFSYGFKSGWADSLLKYHPEYCKLVKFEQYNSSLNWDRNKFETTSTFSDALAKGFLNPTAKTTSPYNHFPYDNSKKDPITSFSSEKTSLESKMVNYKGNGISMWALACIMVKCEGSDMTCYNYYNTTSHFFDTTAMCEGDLNMAWEYFKQMYLQEKRAIIDSAINSTCPSPTATELIAAGHYPNFISAATAVVQYGLGTMNTGDSTAVKDSANTVANNFYQSNCEAYAKQWIQQLSPCNYPDNILRDSIIPRLVRVCTEGADFNHPYGSSTVKPSSTNTFKSFEAVLKDYNSRHGIVNSYRCNPELITAPKPYNQQGVYAEKPIMTKPDSCECGKINSLYTQFQAEGVDTTFSAYILRTTHTKMSEADLSQLRSLCNSSNSCKFLSAAILLPAALQCSTGDICVPCMKIDSLYLIYKATYPNDVPKYEAGTDSIQQYKNDLFSNFMNNRLGFNKTAQEYLRFMADCRIDLPVSGYADSTLCTQLSLRVDMFAEEYGEISCDLLRGAFADYFNQFYHTHATFDEIMSLYETVCGHTPSYFDKEECEFVKWDDCSHLHDMIDKFAEYYDDLPEPKRYPRSESVHYFNSYYGTYFTYEQIDSIYGLSCEGSLVDYYESFDISQHDCEDLSNFISAFNDYYLYLSPKLYRIGEFVQFYNHYFETNFSYEQIDSIYLSICSHHLEEIDGDFTPVSVTDCEWLDEIRLTFNENYYDLLENPPLCTTAFELYFNSKFGTHYNYIQIDSIYEANCEYDLDICDYTLTSLNNGDFCAEMTNHILPGFAIYYQGLSIPKPSQTAAFVTYYGIYLDSNSHNFGPYLTFSNIQYLYYRICNDTLHFAPDPYNGPLLCGKSDIPLPPIQIDSISNCSDSTFFAISGGTELYNNYIDSLKNDFENDYVKKCMNAFQMETFTVKRQVSLYHFTLYYYDQGGNLVKTVPPKGVQVNYSTSWLNDVKTARQSNTDVLPSHTYLTQYRYNTLNQVIAQSTPDGGITHFWYDNLGRLILSKNAKQEIANPTRYYSYTFYDNLGRIEEVGQVEADPIDIGALTTGAGYIYYSDFEAAVLNTYRVQITKTSYDEPYSPLEPVMAAKNLRNRVAWTAYYENSDDMWSLEHQVGSFYTYDIHGNVDTLIQDYRGITLGFPDSSNRFKKIVYKYDLVSGKVNHVAYQPGRADAFYHKYYYDAENRITNVETTHDSIHWENEAYYKYYRHGPLARAVIGQQQVQGVDYAYTLQGWLKGVNGSAITGVYDGSDMGGDGTNNTPVARDVYSFSLYYYGNRDYKPISTSTSNPFASVDVSVVPSSGFKPLFNGNIAAMSTHIPLLGDHLLNAYTYDQLNRLKGMQVHNGFDNRANSWSSISAIDDYKENISYDPNGNILTYHRNGVSSVYTDMDNMEYLYADGTNKLTRIRDSVDNSYYNNDIDDQDEENYHYDEIGNLIYDKQAEIDNITWTVYGKIAKIEKADRSYIQYTYDAAGNRISKYLSSTEKTTWYVRDAQGNVMSVYSWGGGDEQPHKGQLTQTEVHLYGSSRLGIMQPNINVQEISYPEEVELESFVTAYIHNFTRGEKAFELSNHLGNVLVTVSDKKKGHDDGTQHIDYYEAEIVSANDYAPFGMQLQGRTYQAANYRYGFNGKENDNEVKGEGNQQDYGMRIYDPRVGRFLSVDPLTNKYPELTPYQFASNMPIIAVDLDGEEAKIVTVYHGTNNQPFFTYTSNKVISFLPSKMTIVIHKYYGYDNNGQWTVLRTTPEVKIQNNGVDFQTGRIDLSAQTLGKLSETYESKGVATVSSGNGDAGGVSYGCWQLASKRHRASEFLAGEGKKYATEFGDSKEGSSEFSATWKKIAEREPEAFKEAQHGFIKRTHYNVVVASIKSNLGLDINNRSAVLQDVVWSTAVQHGPANTIVQDALSGLDVTKLTDAEIIKLIYAERGKVNANGTLVHFSKNSTQVQSSVKNRFKAEEKDALNKLQANK